MRDATEPVDDADVPVIDLLYISVRLPGQSAAASVLVFGFSSFPLFLAAWTPRMAALVAALVARSTCPGPFHPRPGSIFLGRCGNKRWATSSSPRTAWRGLETKYRAVETTSLRQYHQEAARTWMGDNTGPRGGTEQDTRSLLAVLWLFRSDEYWPATGWTKHLSGLSEIPVDQEK